MPSCGTCRHFRRIEQDLTGDAGLCYGAPPTALLTTGGLAGIRPPVSRGEDPCGMYEPIPPAQETPRLSLLPGGRGNASGLSTADPQEPPAAA